MLFGEQDVPGAGRSHGRRWSLGGRVHSLIVSRLRRIFRDAGGGGNFAHMGEKPHSITRKIVRFPGILWHPNAGRPIACKGSRSRVRAERSRLCEEGTRMPPPLMIDNTNVREFRGLRPA